MPVPGPRTQFRPLPGYTNPDGDTPDRINPWEWPEPIAEPGRSPGTMVLSLRGNVLGAGQVRRLWRQSVQYIAAQASYSWTDSAPGPGRPITRPGALGLTTAVRYMTRSLYAAGGTDNSRFGALHTTVHPKVRSKPVSLNAGGVRNRPTVRNRLTSFGSRVTPLNSKVPAARQ